MSWLWMIVIGLVAGAIAKAIMPGKDPGGLIATILIGIAGSFLGGFLGRTMGLSDTEGGAGFVGSIIGALILLAGYRMLVGRGRTV